jgi:hypothetical protein
MPAMWRSAILCAVMLAAWPASAADDDRCAESYEAAQLKRLDRRLIDARRELIACMAEGCPDVARRHCSEWLIEVERDIPTVVFAFVDERGARREDVRVSVDGELVAETLDGGAVPLDPGEHWVAFEPAGGAAVERRYTLLTGEKNRKILVSLRAPVRPAPAPPAVAPSPDPVDEPAPSVHPATWALGGLTLAGFGVFAGFGLHSIALEDCQNVCTDDQVDSIVSERIVADVGLGVGAAALAATVLVAVLTYE